MKTQEFDNILNACLERLLKGGTIEQCLARYPEQAMELEPLLQTVVTARKVTDIKPHPEFRERARYQFRSALREIQGEKKHYFFSWQPRWATVVIIILVFLVASSGTVAAASNSMPGEPLYQVKQATETLQLTLTPSKLGKAELYAKLMDRRMAEITNMADEGKPEQVEKAAERLNDHLTAMTDLVTDIGKPPREKEAVLMAPAPAPKAMEAAPAPPAAGEPEETEKLQAPPRMAQQETPPGLAKDRKAGGGEDKEAQKTKIKEIIASRAAEQPEVLREILKKVPASAEPELRRAIDGYEKALQALD